MSQSEHKLNDVAKEMIDYLTRKVITAIDGWPSSDPRDKPAILEATISALQAAADHTEWSKE
jgi:hypothetical protein